MVFLLCKSEMSDAAVRKRKVGSAPTKQPIIVDDNEDVKKVNISCPGRLTLDAADTDQQSWYPGKPASKYQRRDA